MPFKRSIHTFFFVLVMLLPDFISATPKPDYLILLHGLARTEKSMVVIGYHVRKHGYEVININYPGRTIPIDQVAAGLADSIALYCPDTTRKLNFITHSMGGIVVRYYLANNSVPNLGRVVMLSPPNKGSQLVDKMGDWWIFEKLMGPPGEELGTDSLSVPMSLPPVTYPVGIIMGDHSIGPPFSKVLPGPDDGLVSVADAKVTGMSDFLVVPRNHFTIKYSAKVAAEAVYFLKNGEFEHESWNHMKWLDSLTVPRYRPLINTR
ncbi:MAG TPA: hypothetical protein DHU63_10500 [Candidatus Marinimicrobia bacterium]|nr:MAG: hypothetical protein AUJ47_08965 [Candidatus Marinimicrobia bacterium CG1_02_48_14]HCW76950.1 hypothetical protein [Candidatus Neomarinimicrobiota bacterium]